MSKNTEYRIQSTEHKVQSTDSFEDRLTKSANRLREQSEKSLSTPEMIAVPPKHTRYWGWMATPAAAAVGLVIGLFFSHFMQTTSFAHRPAERADNFTVPLVSADLSGHSIADDGTDYSLLISL